MPVTVDDVRAVAQPLPRSYEVLVRDRVKFRVGQIVWLAFSRDETTMGFAFPKEERAALVASAPDTFLLPGPSDMRYHWVVARMAALDLDEMREIVLDAWRFVVPKKVARDYEDGTSSRRPHS
ncbi:MAG TPA: MmcQ/YjbR family DNA-binding protein [Lapillicoccus sp.]|nr:MmcQ/YjbR family DNA-binding protein [Lapillicoccus sp.]